MKEFNISGGYKLQGGYLDITDHRQTSWMSVCGHSEWTEQIRERAFVHVRVWPVCMCAWLSMHECEPMCASLIIHVWFNTVGHQQLWQASAVERGVLSLPGNAWSQPKRSPLLSFPLFFLLRTSSPFPVNHTGGTAHCRAWLGMKKHKCAMTPRLFLSQRTWEDSVWLLYNFNSYLSLNARQTSSHCLISTIMGH